MTGKKSIASSVTGSITSIAPILFSACKSGACVGVCVSPVASIFGISSATIASSPIVAAIEPVLIALSAVSFTISYYSLYVLPKFSCGTSGDCACGPSAKEIRKVKISKAVFWIGLLLSLSFLSYFEYSKYSNSSSSNLAQTECSGSECAPGECSSETEETMAACDSSSACCEKVEEETPKINK